MVGAVVCSAPAFIHVISLVTDRPLLHLLCPCCLGLEQHKTFNATPWNTAATQPQPLQGYPGCWVGSPQPKASHTTSRDCLQQTPCLLVDVLVKNQHIEEPQQTSCIECPKAIHVTQGQHGGLHANNKTRESQLQLLHHIYRLLMFAPACKLARVSALEMRA